MVTKSNRKKCRWAIAVASAVVAMRSSAASASLTINLMFPDGSHTRTVTASDQLLDIPVSVYAIITGNSPISTTNYDGIVYAYYKILSSVGAGGALRGNIDSGLADLSYAPRLNANLNFSSQGSQPGNVADINGDGIADLGGGGTDPGSAAAKPRSAPTLFSYPDASVFGHDFRTGAPNVIFDSTNPTSFGFLVETIYFRTDLSMSIGQSTTLNPTPANLAPQGLNDSLYYQDAPSTTIPNPPYLNGGAIRPGSSVQFTVVPEPATITALLALSPLALARRRQRSIRQVLRDDAKRLPWMRRVQLKLSGRFAK